VGDTRQHEAVEAGRPYAQLQEAGLRTARLDEIIRQKDPALKEVVEQLARGEVRDAIGNLNEQGRVHEIGDRQERIAEIAREYVRSPENTLVISPDNESRREINQHIHRAMQDTGQVKGEEHRVHVLYARQHPHLDYGYAVTSHSSQGQTADRVLIHVDSEQAHGELLNSRMAYVSVSRAQYDAQIYTNDAATLGQELSRDVSKSVALEDMTIAKSLDPQPVQQIVEQLGLGLSL